MSLLELLPIAAIISVVPVALFLAAPGRKNAAHDWIFPALLSALFLAWSIATIINEGFIGVWNNHTQSMWGNQVWFDLLIAISIGWGFIVGPARKLGMHVYRWLFLILCTGCIGFLAMIARFLFLQERASS